MTALSTKRAAERSRRRLRDLRALAKRHATAIALEYGHIDYRIVMQCDWLAEDLERRIQGLDELIREVGKPAAEGQADR